MQVSLGGKETRIFLVTGVDLHAETLVPKSRQIDALLSRTSAARPIYCCTINPFQIAFIVSDDVARNVEHHLLDFTGKANGAADTRGGLDSFSLVQQFVNKYTRSDGGKIGPKV
ncbi:MAG: hypothetical protein R2838_02665 [Caldilineaceae bacterium]